VPKRDRRILIWIVALSLLALATGLPAGSALAGKLADTTLGPSLKLAAASADQPGPSGPSTATPTFTRVPTSTPMGTCVARAFINATACRVSGSGSQQWQASVTILGYTSGDSAIVSVCGSGGTSCGVARTMTCNA